MKQIRILSLLMALFLLSAALPFSLTVTAKTVTVTATAVNSARGEGQLIIYTPEYGSSTNTNEWGAEAVVDQNHKVLSVGNNNSSIPEGGFVLSGHDPDGGGGMKTWVLQNIEVGDYVYYDERTLLITVSDTPLNEDEVVFYEVSTTITGFDRARYENDLIIYTGTQGKTSGTNAWGYEVTVKDGLVISLGGNDSEIAANGFVVSGHGTAADWLRANVRLGMRAEMDRTGMTIKFIYDAEALEKTLPLALEELSPLLEEAKASYLYMDYEAFETNLQAAKDALTAAIKAHNDGGSDKAFVTACNDVSDRIDLLRASISESYTVQYRAVWVRPTQKSAAEVDDYVKQLHEAGINTVCVEGNFNNTVIMNVPDGCLFEHSSAFSYDVLQAYVDACHKYGMECHLWMAIFLDGYSNQSNYYQSIVYKNPEWLSLNQNGTPDNDNGFMMIDPANEEARAYLVDFYEYIVRTYDIDCFELDYIRYYVREDSLDFGYTQAAFKGFEEAYHYGVTPTFDMQADYWADWVQYRKDCVSAMVQAVREMIDRVKPSLLLSADVVAIVDSAGAYNYQDYPSWLEMGWLDQLHPMAYGDGFGDDIRRQVEMSGDRCMVVTGLGVYLESLGASEMVRQAIEDTQYGTYGDAFFEASAYLKDQAGPALLQSVYRNDAITPFLDSEAAIKAGLAYMDGRIEEILLPLEGLSEAEAQTLRTAIQAATDSVQESLIPAQPLLSLREAIRAVENEQAKARLEEDLLRIERIICTVYKVSREALTGNLELPTPEPEPEVSDPTESAASSEESTSETQSAVDSESNGAGSLLPWIIGLSILAVALIAVAVVLLVRKK